MASEQYPVKILGLCLMPDHIHVLLKADSESTISKFVQQYTSRFSRAFNSSAGLSGSLFNPRFGRAAKTGAKKIRTAISYLYNNPVERHLSRNAEAYQWHFLSYSDSSCPFSETIPIREAGWAMRRAISEIRSLRMRGLDLGYNFLDRVSKPLKKADRKRLTDYIISSYRCIDYEEAVFYYGSYAQMVLAINSNTGSEYDISEVMEKGSDKIYNRMANYMINFTGQQDVKSILALPKARKCELAALLKDATGASQRQIEKFLHIGPELPPKA